MDLRGVGDGSGVVVGQASQLKEDVGQSTSKPTERSRRQLAFGGYSRAASPSSSIRGQLSPDLEVLCTGTDQRGRTTQNPDMVSVAIMAIMGWGGGYPILTNVLQVGGGRKYFVDSRDAVALYARFNAKQSTRYNTGFEALRSDAARSDRACGL